MLPQQESEFSRRLGKIAGMNKLTVTTRKDVQAWPEDGILTRPCELPLRGALSPLFIVATCAQTGREYSMRRRSGTIHRARITTVAPAIGGHLRLDDDLVAEMALPGSRRTEQLTWPYWKS